MDRSHALGVDGVGPIVEATLIQSYARNLQLLQCLTLVFVLFLSFSIVLSVSLNEWIDTYLHDALFSNQSLAGHLHCVIYIN